MNLHAQDGLNASYFLSGPVYNTRSAKFLNDSAQYAWGKSVRESDLGAQVVKDMSWDLDAYLSSFSDIIGIDISEKSTPNIFTLLDYGFRYARNSVETSQSMNFFLRPFAYYEEESLMPDSDEQFQETSSYPSAQATYGWTLGMLLSEACPDRQDAILKRAYEIGTSSVIAGYNWQSDAETGRELACAIVALIHSHQGILYQVKLAQDEYQKKKAGTRGDGPYLYADDLPDPTKYLPNPPAEGSAEYDYDVTTYYDSKSIRETSRGDMAVRDANSSLANIISTFSPEFGKSISASNTPELYRLLDSMYPVATEAIDNSKTYYSRLRPYVLYNEPTGYPADEDELRYSGAYPSGHAFFGWIIALALSEVNPAQLTSLMHRAYEFGQSRVILGYHWQSDVTAGRLVGGAVFARLHGSKDFIDQMERAIQEFKGGSSIKALDAQADAEAPVYTVGGVRLNGWPARHGIYIQGGKKVVR